MMETPASYSPSDTKSPQSSESVIGLLYDQFRNEIPSNKEAIDLLNRMSAAAGALKCPHCGREVELEDYGVRTTICLCKNKIWLTARTFFDHIRRPMAWAGAIWFMERGVVLSASKIRELFKVSNDCAWWINQEIGTVLTEEIGAEAVEVPSSMFRALVRKRSRETPARSHPRSEEDQLDNDQKDDRQTSTDLIRPVHATTLTTPIDAAREDPTSAESASPSGVSTPIDSILATLNLAQRQVYDLLTAEPVHSDVLCDRTGIRVGELTGILMLLEVNGLALQLPGNRYTRPTAKQTSDQKFESECRAQTKGTVSQITKFIKQTFYGVSRKHLQRFLALSWCHVDRVRWPVGSILQACLRAGPISRQEIRAYVTPPIVKIPAV